MLFAKLSAHSKGIILTILLLLQLLHITNALPKQKSFSVSPELLPGISSFENEETIPVMHAGLMPLADKTDESYFFWKFHRQNFDSPSLLVWLNGGPGCSSLDGALLELGPLRVNDDKKLYFHQDSWYSRSDLLFVDQPLGTGFSQGKEKEYDTTLEEVAQNFLDFLRNYYEVFPEDAEKDLILAGESFAGQYIPYISKAIMESNSKADENDRIFNLKAIMLGNAWVDPNTQSLSYLPFALENSIVTKETEGFEDLLNTHKSCQTAVNQGKDSFDYPECDKIILKILDITADFSDNAPSNEVCLNIYDFRLRDSFPACGMEWPVEVSYTADFLSTPGILEALNLDASKLKPWQECNIDVQKKLSNKNSVPSIRLIPDLLDSNISVIMFNGDKDLICNNRGVMDSLKGIHWGGKMGFGNLTQHYNLVLKEEDSGLETMAGKIIYDEGLTFVDIFNASHMSPYGHSLATRAIIDVFYNDVDLIESPGNDTLVASTAFDLDMSGYDENNDSEIKEAEHNNENANEGNDNNKEVNERPNDEKEGQDEENKELYNEEKENDSEEGESEEEEQEEEEEDETLPEFTKGRTISLLAGSLLLAILIALYYHRKLKARDIRTMIRQRARQIDNATGKASSWAKDLERNASKVFAHESNAAGSSRTQKPATSSSATKSDNIGVSNLQVDESFELDDL